MLLLARILSHFKYFLGYFTLAFQSYISRLIKFPDKSAGKAKREVNRKRRANTGLNTRWYCRSLNMSPSESHKSIQDMFLTDQMKTRRIFSSTDIVNAQATITINKATPKMTVNQQFRMRPSHAVKSDSPQIQLFNKSIRSNLKSTCPATLTYFMARFKKAPEFSQMTNITQCQMKFERWRMTSPNMTISHEKPDPIGRFIGQTIKSPLIVLIDFIKCTRPTFYSITLKNIGNTWHANFIFLCQFVGIFARKITRNNYLTLFPRKFPNRNPSWFGAEGFNNFIYRTPSDVEFITDSSHWLTGHIGSMDSGMFRIGKPFIHTVNIAQLATESE